MNEFRKQGEEQYFRLQNASVGAIMEATERREQSENSQLSQLNKHTKSLSQVSSDYNELNKSKSGVKLNISNILQKEGAEVLVLDS